MSKLENSIINNIKMLSLDMIKEAGSGDTNLSLSNANIFYTLFMNHLIFNNKDENFLNRDRVVINNRFLPLMYSTLHLFGYNISMDNLKEYKKLNSLTPGCANQLTPGIEIASRTNGDVIASGVGIALGERYLESLAKIEKEKSNLINFHTYVICDYDDIESGIAYESLSFASKEKLSKLVLIVVKDNIDVLYGEDLIDRFKAIDFNIIETKSNSTSSIDDAIDDAKDSKKPTIIIVNNIYQKDSIESKNHYNKPLTNEEMSSLREKYKIDLPFFVNKEYYEEINKSLDKRLNKLLEKWRVERNESLKDLKLKEIIALLENKSLKINYNIDNLKINDNYDEELLIGNNKIFNIIASKSPFVLSLSNSFIYTKTNIQKSDLMSVSNPTGRNILFGSRTYAMGGIANGLASLGFKVFVSSPLIECNKLRTFIKFSTENDLSVNYIFTNDTFLNTYLDDGNSAVDEINSLRLIPNLINFRPADINEIIGIYDIIANYKKTTTIIIGNEKVKKLLGTNPKYVVAGAYRILREKGEANGVLIASGEEVSIAIKIASDLLPYGIDLRVISMPSHELFDRQNDRYKYTLLPYDLKTFVIEFGSTNIWNKYATSNEYILGMDKYSTSGTREELLNYHNLDMDSLKTRIVELMKK